MNENPKAGVELNVYEAQIMDPNQSGRFGCRAVEVQRGGMLSVSEGRQINTTKHFGGGVNVSAGATLLKKKSGALFHEVHAHHILNDKCGQCLATSNKTRHRKVINSKSGSTAQATALLFGDLLSDNN